MNGQVNGSNNLHEIPENKHVHRFYFLEFGQIKEERDMEADLWNTLCIHGKILLFYLI